jgi:hypothetical protein
MDRRPEPPATPHDGSEQRAGGTDDRGSRGVMLIAAAVGLCLVVAGVSVAVFSSPGGGQAGRAAGAGHVVGAGNNPAATAPAAQPTSPVASSPASSRPRGTNDGLARSVLRWPPGRTHQILLWDAGLGGKTLAAVEEQMGTAMQSAGLKLYATMRLACAQLASDVSTAQAGPLIPDNAMQRLYAEALAGLSRAATTCQTAISMRGDGEDVEAHVNRSLLSRSRVEFAAASAKLYRAIGEIESLHH